MKSALPFLSTVLTALLPAFPHFGADAAQQKPNVVIFITDDESWLERSAYGWSKIPTPNFDRVAKEGILFTRAYTSAPSCTPSRAALLAGRNFWELEQGAFIQAWLPSKFTTLPDLMEADGYCAGYTGKGWGPGVDKAPESKRTRNPAGDVYNGNKVAQAEEGLSTIDYAANFERFLKRRQGKKPFLFWVGSIEPHSPCCKTNYQRLEKEYKTSLADIKVPGFLPDTPGVRKSRANMLYEVCRADENLGKIINLLQAHGELENTLLIVTADNGTQVLRSKATVYDWGLHVPLAVMWPARVEPGRRVDDFINFADMAPTILESAGLPVPRNMSGRSFTNVLFSGASGRVDPARSWTVCGLEWHGEKDPLSLAGRMIRDERFQYILNYYTGPRRPDYAPKALPDSEYRHTANTGSEFDLVSKHPNHAKVKRFTKLLYGPRPLEELYDCEADPWELKNLADLPEYAPIKERLKKQLEDYQKQTGDPRITGNMDIFERTRAYVQNRKFGEGGYANSK